MKTSAIPINQTISELYGFLGLELSKNAEAFYIGTHEGIRGVLPEAITPFRNAFFEISLVLGGSPLEYRINNKTFRTPEKYLVFNAPGQVHQWQGIQPDLSGFVMFFRPEFVGRVFQEKALNDFPFFNIYEANLFDLSPKRAEQCRFYYQQIHENFHGGDSSAQALVKANLQAILWLCNQIYEDLNKGNSAQKEVDGLVASYRHLVNENFLEATTVNEYADMLHITPNYLSQLIRETLGKNAKSIIDERIMLEADYLLTYSDLSVKEICYRLNFQEPTHFTRFFKKHRGMTPGNFRK